MKKEKKTVKVTITKEELESLLMLLKILDEATFKEVEGYSTMIRVISHVYKVKEITDRIRKNFIPMKAIAPMKLSKKESKKDV